MKVKRVLPTGSQKGDLLSLPWQVTAPSQFLKAHSTGVAVYLHCFYVFIVDHYTSITDSELTRTCSSGPGSIHHDHLGSPQQNPIGLAASRLSSPQTNVCVHLRGDRTACCRLLWPAQISRTIWEGAPVLPRNVILLDAKLNVPCNRVWVEVLYLYKHTGPGVTPALQRKSRKEAERHSWSCLKQGLRPVWQRQSRSRAETVLLGFIEQD